ncbi:hypothetical protein D9M68_805420 [compost metagenome]
MQQTRGFNGFGDRVVFHQREVGGFAQQRGARGLRGIGGHCKRFTQALREIGHPAFLFLAHAPPGAGQAVALSDFKALLFGLLQAHHRRVKTAPQHRGGVFKRLGQALLQQSGGYRHRLVAALCRWVGV